MENQKAVSFRLDLKLIITSSGPVNRGVVYQLLRFLSCTWTLNWLFCNRSIWNRSWTLTALKIQKNPITVLNFILICIGIKVIYLYNEIFVFCNLESRSHCIISFLFKIPNPLVFGTTKWQRRRVKFFCFFGLKTTWPFALLINILKFRK